MRRNGWGEETEGVRRKAFFGEVGEESVRFDYLLLYLILFLRITLRFLLIFRWLLWLPKEANLFLTFVYLIFVFSRMSCMLDIFCVCVLSSLRSSHHALWKALLVFVIQGLVFSGIISPYTLLCSSSFFGLFLFLFSFSSLFPSILGIFWRGDSSLQESSILHHTHFPFIHSPSHSLTYMESHGCMLSFTPSHTH